MSNLRSKIMDECPEEFEDKLKDFIDDIEREVNDIKDNMDITSVSYIDSIGIAFDDIKRLAKELY